MQKAREMGCKGSEFPPFSALTVTVPGAAAAWEDTIKTYGKLSLKQVMCNSMSCSCHASCYVVLCRAIALSCKAHAVA